MTDIWDEKPDAELVDGISGIVAYEATEMDAGLERVKEYWDNTMEMNRKQFHEIGKEISLTALIEKAGFVV